MGPPVEEAFSLYYGLEKSDARQAADDFRQHYLEYGIEDMRLFDGVEEMLSRLRKARTGLVAVSSGSGIYVSRLMRRYGLASMFITFRGGSIDAGWSKRRIIGQILDELPVLEGKSMVVVGDREDDVLAARENGLPSVAVSYGYGSAEELRNAAADTVVESVERLAAALMS